MISAAASKRRPRTAAGFVGAVALALLLTSCGGSDDDGQADSASTPATSTSPSNLVPLVKSRDGGTLTSASDVTTTVRSLLYKRLRSEPDELVPSARLVDDLGADEFDLVNIQMQLEEVFGIEIADDEYEQVATIGDLVALVNRKVG